MKYSKEETSCTNKRKACSVDDIDTVTGHHGVVRFSDGMLLHLQIVKQR